MRVFKAETETHFDEKAVIQMLKAGLLICFKNFAGTQKMKFFEKKNLLQFFFDLSQKNSAAQN
jgi:hypothetical protein